MNDDALDSLLSRARRAGPRDTSQAQYGFETRLLARLSPQPFAVWLWRLAPFFAILAIAVSWNAWHGGSENEYAIGNALEENAPEWTYIAGLTGRKL